MPEFKKGDTVKLRSGGPLMTVVTVGGYSDYEDGVRCMWFDGPDTREKVFESAVLRAVDTERSHIATIERG
jgi:uncharacterized protein YodC (DUF2158 family)